MRSRGLTGEEIPRIIGQTGFMRALNEFPEEQLHYSPEAAVDEILLVRPDGASGELLMKPEGLF